MKVFQAVTFVGLATGAKAVTSAFNFNPDNLHALSDYIPSDQCANGDIDTIIANFALEDNVKAFCLHQYKEADCKEQDAQSTYEWEILYFENPETKFLYDIYHLESPAKSAKMIPGPCPAK